jgi:hypothetical protein
MSETLTHLTSVVAISKAGDHKVLDVYKGYDDDIVGQLVEKSKEPGIPKGDSTSRYMNEYTFHQWRTKGIGGRAMYPVLDPDTRELHAIVNYGIKEFPEADYRMSDPVDGSLRRLKEASTMSDTYAIRTYQSARGIGAARPLTLATMSHYVDQRLHDNRFEFPLTGLWLETDTSNVPAVATYLDLDKQGTGFESVAKSPHGERLAMMLPLHRILYLVTPGNY